MLRDGPEEVDYGRFRGESVELPRSGVRPRRRIGRPVAAGLGVLVVLIAMVILLPPAPQRQAPAVTPLPEPPGGTLADITGDDVLHELRVTQAAMRREMALLRQWASEAGTAPAEPDLARVLAELHAKQSELDGLVRHLEAGQARLLDMAVRQGIWIEIVSQRVGVLEQAMEERLKEQGN